MALIQTIWHSIRAGSAFAVMGLLCACGGSGDDPVDPPEPPNPPDTVEVFVGDIVVTEGDTATTDALFTVIASAAPATAVTIEYATADGSAASPEDFTATSGTATIAAGSTSADIIVSVNGDTLVEADETFVLTLSNPGGDATLGRAAATATITNDDVAPPSVLTLSNVSVDERDSGTVSLILIVTLDVAASADVTFDYATTDGSATAIDDYIAIDDSAVISAGDLSTTITVGIVGDTEVEADETFRIVLSNLSTNAVASADVATVTIVNDDFPVNVGMRLNDTGQALCTTALDYDQPCDDPGVGTDQFPDQDAQFGRDATNNDDSDGHAGFSFTKLDAGGVPLANQDANYGQEPWACVRDEVTGLTWEVKTSAAPADRHDTSYSFSWYDPYGVSGSDTRGLEDGGECFDSDRCDTAKYAEDVNASGFCGFSDWRLPTRTELLSIMNFGADYDPPVSGWKAVFIDTMYFPNTTLERSYWTSSPAGISDIRVVAFVGDPSRREPAFQALAIRLVRGGN